MSIIKWFRRKFTGRALVTDPVTGDTLSLSQYAFLAIDRLTKVEQMRAYIASSGETADLMQRVRAMKADFDAHANDILNSFFVPMNINAPELSEYVRTSDPRIAAAVEHRLRDFARLTIAYESGTLAAPNTGEQARSGNSERDPLSPQQVEDQSVRRAIEQQTAILSSHLQTLNHLKDSSRRGGEARRVDVDAQEVAEFVAERTLAGAKRESAVNAAARHFGVSPRTIENRLREAKK